MDTTHFHNICACGRLFSQGGGLKNHQRSCLKTKKCLASVFAKAKEVWQPKKRRRLQDSGHEGGQLLQVDQQMGQSTIEEATVAPSSSDSVRARQNRIEETVAPSSSDSAQVSESLFVSCSSH